MDTISWTWVAKNINQSECEVRWFISGGSKGKDFSRGNWASPSWNITQEVGLECFQMGKKVNIGQCDGEHRVGKPFKFYLLKYSFEVRNLLVQLINIAYLAKFVVLCCTHTIKPSNFELDMEKNQIIRAASVTFLWIWLNLLCWIMDYIKRIGLSGCGH